MTRRLGGTKKSLAAIAALSLAATLACVGAISGCGSSNGTAQTTDGGDAGPDVLPVEEPMPVIDTGMPPVIDTGMPTPPPPVCTTPTITPNGGAVTIGSTVAIAGPTGASIYYTTDGTGPTHASQLYSGPIQLSQGETIHAIASDGTVCTDSAVATATFTVMLGDGGLTPPIFNPPSTTENNDFLVSLSDGAIGATMCFTTDGATLPTCTITGSTPTCGAGSTTYNAGAGLNAAGSVSITPAITNAATGTVTIQAVACEVGGTTTAVAKQQYTLQVANPTMQGPAPGNLAFNVAGQSPTAGSATNGASIRVSTTGTAVTCTTGTLLTGANGAAINPGNPGLTQNTTFSVIACKAGYAPSMAESFAYTITLNPPTFATVAGTYDSTFSAGFPGTTNPNAYTSGNGNPTLWYCSSTMVTEPACGTTMGACTTGTAGPIPITTTGTTLATVACALNFNASQPATAAYTLQLSPPAIYSPGCTLANGNAADCLLANGATTPVTSYTIPAAGFAAGPNVEASPGAASLTPVGATANGTGAYAFACAAKGGTPSCGTSSCTAGTSIAPTAAQITANGTLGHYFVTTPGVAFSNAALTIAAGDSWSVIACPGTSTAFLPSPVTTVVFSAPGQAKAPSITPGTETANNTVVATVANQDTASTAICTSLATPAPTTTPCNAAGTACTGAGWTNNVVTPFGDPTTKVASLTLNSGGSGYATAPTVTIAPPGAGTQAIATATVGFSIGSVTVNTAGSGCNANTITVTLGAPGGGGTTATATATVSGANNSVSAITLVNAGSGYTAAPAVSFTNCTTPPTATAVLSATGSVIGFTVANAGSGYSTVPAVTIAGNATATAVLSDSFLVSGIKTNTETLTAVACGGQTSPPVAATYSFQLAEPDFYQGATVGNGLNGGGPVTYGSTVNINTTTTNGDLGTRFICATTNGTAPNCTCTPGTGVFKFNSANIPGTSATTPAAPVITGNTTLQAIACDSSGANTWTASAVRSAALTVGLPTPVLTNPGGTYENNVTLTLSNAGVYPGGTVFCYTATSGATPQCSTGATPACTGGSLTFTSGTTTVTQTATDIKVIACSSTLTSPATGDNNYVLNVTPVVVTNANTTLACGANNVTIGLDCSVNGGVCSTATVNANGPTLGSEFCYSTTVAVPNCAGGAGITCITAANANSVPAATTITITGNTTINAASCLVSGTQTFNSTTTTPAVAFTPFTFTPIIDGSLADWLAGTAAAPAADLTLTTDLGVGTSQGYFGYDTGNYYFAYNNIPSGGAATTFVTIYVGDATGAAGGTTNLLAPDTNSTSAAVLPAGTDAKYAFTVETDTKAVTAYSYNATAGMWQTATFTGTVATAGTDLELSVPKANVGSLAQVNVLGALVTNVGQTNGNAANPAAATDTWPETGGVALFKDFAQANTASCQAPNAHILP